MHRQSRTCCRHPPPGVASSIKGLREARGPVCGQERLLQVEAVVLVTNVCASGSCCQVMPVLVGYGCNVWLFGPGDLLLRRFWC